MVLKALSNLVTGSIILKCRAFCWECAAFQDRWSHGIGLSGQFYCTEIRKVEKEKFYFITYDWHIYCYLQLVHGVES